MNYSLTNKSDIEFWKTCREAAWNDYFIWLDKIDKTRDKYKRQNFEKQLKKESKEAQHYDELLETTLYNFDSQ